ncbi:MAG: NTP transferase domain-containing protein [Anaerolineae bacterium]|nr:NTP transferase domain-containing protein [Anaerolineae bacterium]
MKAVILAGGEGSRLRPLTIERPKPMIPIVNKPVLKHILDLLQRHNITEAVITAQYLAEFIQDYFGDGSNFGMNIRYCIEESPLGTAGSVKNTQAYLDDTFLVISGDSVTNLNLTELIEYHKKSNTLATLALYRLADPMDYGVININHKGQITNFQEKPGRGTVMSDYVNTGIYVLEPKILDFFEPNISFDFANDLFPLVHEQGHPLYGYVAGGYWCDVGNIAEYMRATANALHGEVDGLDLGHYLGDGIWSGGDTDIAPDVRLEGPIYLGNSVQIKSGAVIRGPTVIRDYTVIDNEAIIDRSILWRNCYIGERVQLSGAIVLRQCSLKANATVFEGVVIGDGTIVGEGAVIHPSVKIWPGKEIEPGTTVNSSIVWGSQGRRLLFGRFGVTGVVNIDLTPEFSAKLGAAFGTTLSKGSIVTMNRDMNRSSRMIKRALISGLPSAGINVWDLGAQPIPVASYYTKVIGAEGGVHVRISPFDERVIDILFIDNQGLNLSKDRERHIERLFFREDLRRVFLEDIGNIQDVPEARDHYIRDFLKHLNTRAIQDAGFHLVVDFADTALAEILSIILDALNCSVVSLGSTTAKSGEIMSQAQFQASLKQMQVISKTTDMQLGVRLNPGGERILLVDDRGFLLEGTTACAAMTELVLRDAPGSAIAVPVNLPNVFEKIAATYNGRVIRTEIGRDILAKTASGDNIIMAGDGQGNFIFPDFQCAVDGLMTLAKMLEFLATQKTTLSDTVDNLPPYYIAERRVSCVWEAKAGVMRLINQKFEERKDQRIVTGVRIELAPDHWVLIMPDLDQPCFRITTEAESQTKAEALADEYAQIIEKISPLG